MSVPIIAFFNNKGGVGKTSLVYHLAWMYADFGWRVLAADFDPQANLTAAFLDEDRLETLWSDDISPGTVFGALSPLKRGVGEIAIPEPEPIADGLALLPGDLALSGFEDQLSEVWPKCMDRDERSFRVTSAFWRLMQGAAEKARAYFVLLDLGPNLGAINRAALVASDFVAMPLAPDLYSLQGLKNLGPTLRRWRQEWKERLDKSPVPDLPLPSGRMEPAGYIVMKHGVRLDRPVKAYERWIQRIPEIYYKYVLSQPLPNNITLDNDPHRLSLLKHYRSLMPMAQEARKPIFHLKPADGAIGSHEQATRLAYTDFEGLAKTIAEKTGVGGS